MSIITLTSDWGNKDHYAGSVKGAILKLHLTATIIDISHQVQPFKLYQASFILKSCYNDFPEGTVHIIGINSELIDDTAHVAILKNGQYFISADNGIFSLLFDSAPEKIVEINTKQKKHPTFPAYDIFVPAACHLASGKPIEELGSVRNSVKEMIAFQPIETNNYIRGMIVYVDNYFNAITNISKKLFFETAKNRDYTIKFASYTINKISETYNDVPEGEKLALFGSTGYLQIAQNKGDAANQLGLDVNSLVVVDFEDNDNFLIK